MAILFQRQPLFQFNEIKPVLRRLLVTINDNVLLDKFKGCLIGSLVGDCYGKPYKLCEEVSKQQLQKYFDKLDGPDFKAPYKPHSPNTAFAKCLAQSFINKKAFDVKDVAKRFVKEFFDNPHRDYGDNSANILAKIRGNKFENPYGPASEAYLGMGSYGNSGAARVPPIPLFYYDNPDKMTDVASKSASLTNAHQLGRNGAILLSWAIRIALDLNRDIDRYEYLSSLLEKVSQFEIDEEGLNLKDVHKFRQQLLVIEKLLEFKNPTEHEVVDLLGHGRVAVYSVPTAIYCFLRSFDDISGLETDNKFRRVVQYAISLGGDSDTIAGMAGAISGACFGYSSVSKALQRHCEGYLDFERIASELFISYKNR